MKLFLQFDDDTDERFLSETDTLGAGSVFSSIEGRTTDYILDYKPEFILRDGPAQLHLFFAVTGSVAITPVPLISIPTYPGGVETPIYEEEFLTPDTIETRNTLEGDIGVTFDWSFHVNSNYDLEDAKLILRLIVEDTRADEENPSSLTLDKTSFMDIKIGPGERQEIQAFTNANFRLFQRTEMIFAWTNTDVKEGISIPIYSNVHNKEQIFLDVYTRTDVKEDVTFILGTNVHMTGPFEDEDPHVTNIEIGDFVLPTWAEAETERFSLRKRENLYDLVEELGVDYQILVPPDPPVVTFAETAISNTANRMVEAFEMLKSHTDRTTPGEPFKVFMPSALSGGTVLFRDKEWQMPLGFTAQEYWVPFSIIPINNLNPVGSGNSLWLCLRHRLVGASMSPRYRERAGNLVLRKKVNSLEEIRVWMWDSAAAPFDVTLFVSNPILQRPGFAGNSAALLLG
jgi:hypothetical protein